MVCDDSRWLARSGAICPQCGKVTRSTSDVIDELVQAVVDEGGSLRHVRAETQLSDFLIAAELRSIRTPVAATAASGCRAVVSAGAAKAATGTSSKPTRLRSS